MTQSWEKICPLSELPSGLAKIVDRGNSSVAIFNIAGDLQAIDNTCPHRGGPLGEGHLDGALVTCPWHAWTFDVKSGQCQNNPLAKQKKFAVKVENGEIFLELS